MKFKEGYIYHIYNRGNNKQPIFFADYNYIFFLRKMRKELVNYFRFLAYCLMPNHFHFLVQVKNLNITTDKFITSDDSRMDEYSKAISNRIAVLLRSYNRAINIQESRTGSLFQQKTKSKCLNDLDTNQNDYLKACFFYIHQNPVHAGLVKKLEDWEYSSFLDYAGLRNGTLCDQNLIYEMININKDNFVEQSYAVIKEESLLIIR